MTNNPGQPLTDAEKKHLGPLIRALTASDRFWMRWVMTDRPRHRAKAVVIFDRVLNGRKAT